MSPENRFNHMPWTIADNPLTVDVVEFRRVSGKKVLHEEPLYEKLTDVIAHHFNGSEQQDIIQSREVEKPQWFMVAESDARLFMASLGFKALGKIHLIEGYLDVRGLNVNAYHDTITRKILVSEAKLTHILQTEGPEVATSVLVHELTHDTAPLPDRIVQQQRIDNTSYYKQRNGWITSGTHGDQGTFLEEAFAEYTAGLYRRQNTDSNCHLLPADYIPTIDLPPHLQTNAIVAGPDAHALELLAWGVQQRNIMSAESFIGYWFDARRADTFAQATREVITAINALSPRLYAYLKDLEYSKENWTTARNTIFAIVTR